MKNLMMVASALLAGIGGILAAFGNTNGGILLVISIVIYAYVTSTPKKYKPKYTEEQFNKAMKELENTYEPKI